MKRDQVITDAGAAWQRILESGILDLKDRDCGIEEDLKYQIKSDAPTLEIALEDCPLEVFVRTFFDLTVKPLVTMVRDIYLIYERANAGSKRALLLKVGGTLVELETFRRWYEELSRVGEISEVYDIDWHDIWEIAGVLREASQGYSSSPTWLSDWLESDSIQTGSLPDEFLDLDLTEPLESIRTFTRAHHSIVQRYYSQPGRSPSPLLEQGEVDNSALYPQWACHNETDNLLVQLVVGLVALTAAGDETSKAHKAALSEATAKFHTREFMIDVPSIESLLELPIWKHRYDLYSVWIGSVLILAAEQAGCQVKVCSQDGFIDSGFSESVFAEIQLDKHKLIVYLEKRSPLDNPTGKGRRRGVQPDYSVYSTSESEMCVLVVEAKHYLRAKKANFLAAAIDYSRAHPEAQVAVVNYGRYTSLGWSDEIPPQARDRCHFVSEVAPHGLGKRELLDVCQRVLETAVLRTTVKTSETRAIIVDVSQSMEVVLAASNFAGDLLAAHPLDDSFDDILIAVDIEELDRIPFTQKAISEIAELARGWGTNLIPATDQALDEFCKVYVLTDPQGCAELQEQPDWTLEPQEFGGQGHNCRFVRVVRSS